MNVTADGAVALAFALLFVILPLFAALGAAWVKRIVLRFEEQPVPRWLSTLSVGFLEFGAGVFMLVMWWNTGARGITCLAFYLVIAAGLNRLLCADWRNIVVLTVIPVLLMLVLVTCGPVGDGSPARRLAEISRYLF